MEFLAPQLLIPTLVLTFQQIQLVLAHGLLQEGNDSSKASGFVLELTSGGILHILFTNMDSSCEMARWFTPTLSQGETKVDVLVFITDDGGTTWRGALSQQDSS